MVRIHFVDVAHIEDNLYGLKNWKIHCTISPTTRPGLCRSFKRFARYDTTKSQVRAIILKMEDCIDAENTDSRRRRSHRESN